MGYIQLYVLHCGLILAGRHEFESWGAAISTNNTMQ